MGDLSGPGLSESYVAEVRTPANFPPPVCGNSDTRTRPWTFVAPRWMAKKHPNVSVQTFTGVLRDGVGDALIGLVGVINWYQRSVLGLDFVVLARLMRFLGFSPLQNSGIIYLDVKIEGTMGGVGGLKAESLVGGAPCLS